MPLAEGIKAVVGHYKRNIKSRRMRQVSKAEDEQRVIWYVVAIPDEVDAHGERIDADTIMAAAWNDPGAPIRLEHGRSDAMAAWEAAGLTDGNGFLQGCQVVESYIMPCTIAAGGMFHGENQLGPLPEGSHIVAVRYPAEIWPEMRDTDHGISLGGLADEEQRA